MALHEGVQHAIGRHDETGNLRHQPEAPCLLAALQRVDAARFLALHPAGRHFHGTVGQLGDNAVVPRVPMVEALSVINRQRQGGLQGEYHLRRLRIVRQPLHRILRGPEGGNHDFLHLLAEFSAFGVQPKALSARQIAQRFPGAFQRSVHRRIGAPVGELATAHTVGDGGKENTLILHPAQGMRILTGCGRRAFPVRRALKRDAEGRNGGILHGFTDFILWEFLQ